jgi:hypothetical protein
VSFTFENLPVDSPTTEHVRQSLEDGRRAHVYGDPGSGKTHAVFAAVEDLDPVWIRLHRGPLQGIWFAADLAQQLGEHAQVVLRELRFGDGLRAALVHAGSLLGDRPLVVDDIDSLTRDPINLDDPASIL